MPQPLEPEDLRRLLPPRTESALSTRPPQDDRAPAEIERAAMVAMHPVRRREFMHGRACAHAALASLGYAGQAVPIGAHREPVWPAGVVGSISHCEPLAAAAVARRADFAGIGIDLARTEPLDAEVLSLICLPAERAWLQNTDEPLRFAKLFFSAKESIFKCIWPTLGHFVDFQEIEIRVDIVAGMFSPIEWAGRLPDPLIRSLKGRFLHRGNWVLTTACIPQPDK